MSPEPDPNSVPDANQPMGRIIARTTLLVISIALLFPNLFNAFAGGAWSRMVLAWGVWRWVAWGVCFAAMTLVRFMGGPKRVG